MWYGLPMINKSVSTGSAWSGSSSLRCDIGYAMQLDPGGSVITTLDCSISVGVRNRDSKRPRWIRALFWRDWLQDPDHVACPFAMQNEMHVLQDARSVIGNGKSGKSLAPFLMVIYADHAPLRTCERCPSRFAPTNGSRTSTTSIQRSVSPRYWRRWLQTNTGGGIDDQRVGLRWWATSLAVSK